MRSFDAVVLCPSTISVDKTFYPAQSKKMKKDKPQNTRPLSVRPMTIHTHRLFLMALCVIAGCVSGCIRPNMRYTEIGSVSARATLQKGVTPLYHEVKITRPTDVSAQRFCLRLPDGKIINQASLTYDGLKRAGVEDVKGYWQRKYYDTKLGMDLDVSHEVGASGIRCLFVGDTLVEISLFTSSTNAVAVGREDTSQFYILPLTQADLEHIFGHPDKVSDGVYW